MNFTQTDSNERPLVDWDRGGIDKPKTTSVRHLSLDGRIIITDMHHAGSGTGEGVGILARKGRGRARHMLPPYADTQRNRVWILNGSVTISVSFAVLYGIQAVADCDVLLPAAVSNFNEYCAMCSS